MVQITILSQSGRTITDIKLEQANPTLLDLKKAYQREKGVGIERQAFYTVTAEGKRGEMLKKDAEPLLANVKRLMFKDLGPQIGYRTVFLVEYFGPLTAFPVIYLLRPLIYGSEEVAKHPLGYTQWVAMTLFIAHFIKRELETLFVHKFSNGYMPLFNIFKNTSYYTACAYYIAYYVLHPLYTEPSFDGIDSRTWTNVFAGLMILMMLSNFYCHLILSNLRKRGSTERKIPRGFLFELVSCPNYTVEIAGWLFFSLMTMTVSGFIFTLVGGVQMMIWAMKKHRLYRKEFKDYPRGRKILIPFIF
jgi:very-long-chain enoyl-CoA reductase